MTEPAAGSQLAAILAEFNALRTELLHHFTFANALVGLQFAGIGVGLTFLDANPVVIAGLSALSSMLWLSYMDHVYSIHRIALYVATELQPSLEVVVSLPVLAWEGWLRQLRSPGGISVGGTTIADVGSESRLGLTYPSVFFGGAAIWYLIYSIVESGSSAGWTIVGRVLAAVLAGAIFIFAARQYRRLTRFTAMIDRTLRRLAERN